LARDPEFVTKELSKKTWPDFVKLFKRPGEWGACWCVCYQRPGPIPKSEGAGLTLSQRAERNRRDKKALVDAGRSHGILVYEGKNPVGWCQYGPREEIPRIDAGRKYKKLSLDNEGRPLWRISCFSVDRKYRHRGVAKIGLEAAIQSIKAKEGGLIEAYPVKGKGALATWFGTVSMFREEGFEFVAPFGKSNVLMRRRI
jgi:hypothetical protein